MQDGAEGFPVYDGRLKIEAMKFQPFRRPFDATRSALPAPDSHSRRFLQHLQASPRQPKLLLHLVALRDVLDRQHHVKDLAVRTLDRRYGLFGSNQISGFSTPEPFPHPRLTGRNYLSKQIGEAVVCVAERE